MIPDVKFKNYYLQFIYSAKTDIVKYKNELEEIVINKEELYNYLDNNKQLLIEAYNINLDDYDEIIIGTPVWWYTISPVVVTFLKENDLSNKTIYPFATNAGWLWSKYFIILWHK